MFDTYRVNSHSREYVPYEKEVNIHRAPTDESIGLLREMEKEALDKFLGYYELKDNMFNAVFNIFQQPWIYPSYKIYCKFSLNQKEYSFNFNVENINFNTREGLNNFILIIKQKMIEQLGQIFTLEFFQSGVFKEAVKYKGTIYGK